MSIKLKTKKIFETLKILVKKPKYLTKGAYAATFDEKKDYVIKKYSLNKGLPTIDLLTLFPNFKESVDPYSYLSQTSDPIDLALLKSFAKKFKKCNYLEIGTWRGESVANIASVADKCVSVSLPDKELMDRGMSESYVKLHRFFSKNLKNINHIQHNSLTFDFSKLNMKFDLIFVDGGHGHEVAKSDTKNAFNLINDKGSIIVWHDCVKLFDKDPNWPVLAGILDGAPKEKRKNIYHISNTLCAAYIPENIKSRFLDFPQKPNKKFKVTIEAHKLKRE